MSNTDEIERTAAFRASAPFPSQARLAAGRERLLAAAVAEQGHAEGAQPARPRRAGPHALAGPGRRAKLAASAAARQWGRRPVLAGGLTAAAAATAAAALVLTSGPAAVPGQHGTTGRTRTVVTAAWTVRENADGTVTIYLRQYFDPAGLRQTLRADGVNAILRSIPDASRRVGKVTTNYPACKYAATNDAPPAVQQAVVGNVTYYSPSLGLYAVIHSGAMPPGSALLLAFIDYVPLKAGKRGPMGVARPVVLNNDTVPACVPIPVPKWRFPAKGA